jgi:hypothetical protein
MDANTVSNVCPFPNNGPGFSGGLFFDNAGGIVPIGLSQGNVVVTPEPASMVLLGIGGAAMAAFGRRKKA